MPEQKELRQVHVVLDTNSIYVEAADMLLNQPMYSLVEQAQDYQDIRLNWYLPSVVIGERRYQMYDIAKKLVGPAKKLERLTNHELGFTEAVLKGHVDRIVAQQLEALRITELSLSYPDVDWSQVAECAVLRKPPFEEGETEKGFRDALLLETYFQLAQKLLTNDRAWVVLVSNDKLVAKAFQTKCSPSSTLRVLKSIEELVTLVNSFRSEVPEDLLAHLVKRALDTFFVKDNPNSLYYRENVVDRLEQKFRDTLLEVPADCASPPTRRKVIIGQPKLISKHGQRLSWSSKVRFVMEARKSNPAKSLAEAINPTSDLSSGTISFALENVEAETNPSNSILDAKSIAEVIVQRALGITPDRRLGSHHFEVLWSVTYTTAGELVRPAVDDFQYIESTWE